MRTKSLTKTNGFTSNTTAASIAAGTSTSSSRWRSSPAPSMKKKIIRKKSRSGFRFSAMKSEIRLEARATPATNAPISCDSPNQTDSSASPRHQPMASRKMYSWMTSKRAISGMSTKRSTSHAKMQIPIKARTSPATSVIRVSPPIPARSTSNRTIAMISCNSRMLIITSPVCR